MDSEYSFLPVNDLLDAIRTRVTIFSRISVIGFTQCPRTVPQYETCWAARTNVSTPVFKRSGVVTV